ncbi:unnamed protein product [Phytomonas sp. Hart1]|nr:unnamed protein product [Phytomonas sp. Hart1]|eukprot:CCW67034.1 unnamed protein product [Phytomonas sp. isolate Hart1]
MASPSHNKKKAAFAKYLIEKEEDTIVCAFGIDYFAGARCGSGFGGLFTGWLSFHQFRKIKNDHVEANLAIGLKLGERNPNFSHWTLLRGMSSQPMMTSGCLALMATTLFKGMKCYLANRRCREFAVDDAAYNRLWESSMQNQDSYEAFVKLFDPTVEEGINNSSKALEGPTKSPGTSSSPSSLSGNPTRTGTAASNSSKPNVVNYYTQMEKLYKTRKEPSAVKERRLPTFMDGVAVGLMGSVMDCYLPQKSIQYYYGMRFGMS